MLRKWSSPFEEFELLRRQIALTVLNDLTSFTRTINSFEIPECELSDAGNNYILKVYLPGVKAGDIEVQATKAAIALQGERKKPVEDSSNYLYSEVQYGKFFRVMKLPLPILPSQIGIGFEDGILTLTLPKDPATRSQVNKFNVGDYIAAKEPKVIDVKPVD